jgi:hypothetical protein
VKSSRDIVYVKLTCDGSSRKSLMKQAITYLTSIPSLGRTLSLFGINQSISEGKALHEFTSRFPRHYKSNSRFTETNANKFEN